MRARRYVSHRGDLVWLSLDPQAGHEQVGRRPALVLSPSAYNGKVGSALFCPVTTHVKGHPFEVAVPAGLAVQGVVSADQVKSLDWQVRRAERAGRLPESELAQVFAMIDALFREGEA